MSVYRDRPEGQRVKAFLAGRTSIGQPLELSFTVSLPDNVEANEQGAHKLAHMAWHTLAGELEPDTETYDVEGEVDADLVQATYDAVLEEVKRQQRTQERFAGFMEKVYENRPKGTTARWN